MDELDSRLEKVFFENYCRDITEYQLAKSKRLERFIRENDLDIKLKYGAFPDRPYDSKAVWGDNTKISSIVKKIKG